MPSSSKSVYAHSSLPGTNGVTMSPSLSISKKPLAATVYSAINAGDAKLDNAAEIFNENALYFVTYTIESIPEGVTEFDVSVTWTDLEGNSNTSDVRTITL